MGIVALRDECRSSGPVQFVRAVSGTPTAVAVLVSISFVVRAVVVLRRETITYLPDEYLYGQIARSFARLDGVAVLGEPAAFPAVLQPLLISPAWLTGDPELAFRMAQLMGVAAMSLSAVPVYLIARSAGVSPGWTFGAVCITLTAPGLLYGGRVSADSVGCLVALIAVHLLVRMLDVATSRSQAAFLALVGTATLARLQYIVLLPVAAVAAIIVERGRVQHAARRFIGIGIALAAPTVVLVVMGASALGRYEAAASLGVSVDTVGTLGSTSFLLAAGCGVAIVPGALAWVASQLVHPSSRARLAFAAVAASLTVALIVLCALMASASGSSRFFERYLLVAVPLSGCAFGAWASAGRPYRLVVYATSATLAVAAAMLPAAEFAAGQGKADSPTLLALDSLERAIGVGSASLVFALVVTAAALVGCLAVRWRPATFVAMALTVLLLGTLSVGAHVTDLASARRVAAESLGPVHGWVDRAAADHVLLIQTPGSDPSDAMQVIAHNDAVATAALLGRGAQPFDGAGRRVAIEPDGRLRVGDRPVRGEVLLATGGTRIALVNARQTTAGPGFRLVRLDDTAQIAYSAIGLRPDGWLDSRARLTVYPPSDGLCRRLSVTLWLPTGPAQTLRLEGAVRERVVVAPGHPIDLQVTAQPNRPRSVTIETANAWFRPGSIVPRATRAWMTATVSAKGKETGAECR